MNANKEINVLVTGVGAIIGYGVIKSLSKSSLHTYIVGMDIYSDAVGQYWCDKFIQAIPAKESDYINFIKRTIDEEKIDIVFFGTEQEIYRCVEAREELGDYFKKLVINKPNILELSKDKWKTHEFLLKSDLKEYAIPSVIEGEFDEIAKVWGNEFLLKPRASYASKGIHKIDNQNDFNFYKQKMGSSFMAQRLMGDSDHEYTVGVFGLGDGTYSGIITLKRKLSQEGATAKAEYYSDDVLKNAVDRLCMAFKPIGPTNFQLRLDGNNYYLLEINPRISSSTSIRMAMNYNEAEMCIKYFLFGDIVYPQVKKGYAARFIDEVVILNE